MNKRNLIKAIGFIMALSLMVSVIFTLSASALYIVKGECPDNATHIINTSTDDITTPVCCDNCGEVIFESDSRWSDGTQHPDYYQSDYLGKGGYVALFGDYDVSSDEIVAYYVVVNEVGGFHELTFDWAINQGFLQYGQFGLELYHNDVMVFTHEMINEEQVNPYENILSSKYAYQASDECQVFKFVFRKYYKGSWADDGRTAYINNIAISDHTHEFGEWKAQVPATVLKKGTVAHMDCTVCGYHFDQEGNNIADITIPELEEIFDENVKFFTVNGVKIPEFDYEPKPYEDINNSGIPVDRIRKAFYNEAEVKYEDGKYKIKDIGATKAEIYNNRDWEYMDMTLVDGYWEIEMSEEDLYDPDVDWYVLVEGEFGEDDVWQIYYENGYPDRRVRFIFDGSERTLYVYISPTEDWVELIYSFFDKIVVDMYYDRMLGRHDVKYNYEDSYEWFRVCYNHDKSVEYVELWHDQDYTYYYFIPEYGWYDISMPDPNYKVSAPAEYEDKDLAYFTNLAPCIIDCDHGDRIPATCETPEMCALCAFVEEGSQALGHDWSDPSCENPSVCKRGCDFDEDNSLGHTDQDLDHKCDRECGKDDMGQHEDLDFDHACDYGCQVAIGEHADEDLSHDCDYGCQVAIGEHADEDLSHDCDYCDGQMGTHSDGDDAEHLCDYGCGEIADDGCPADGNCNECSEDTSTTPDTNDPGTNDPGTNDPDTNEPDTNDPGTNEPGTNEPGTNEPDTNEPGTNVPGTNTDNGSDVVAPKDDNKLSPIAIVGIVLGSVAALGTGGFAIFWFVIRKRT